MGRAPDQVLGLWYASYPSNHLCFVIQRWLKLLSNIMREYLATRTWTVSSAISIKHPVMTQTLYEFRSFNFEQIPILSTIPKCEFYHYSFYSKLFKVFQLLLYVIFWSKSNLVIPTSMITSLVYSVHELHNEVIKWKHFPRYWPFVLGIHWSPVNSPHKGQWHKALMFSLIHTWIKGWVNKHEAGDLRCHRAHYDITLIQ